MDSSGRMVQKPRCWSSESCLEPETTLHLQGPQRPGLLLTPVSKFYEWDATQDIKCHPWLRLAEFLFFSEQRIKLVGYEEEAELNPHSSCICGLICLFPSAHIMYKGETQEQNSLLRIQHMPSLAVCLSIRHSTGRPTMSDLLHGPFPSLPCGWPDLPREVGSADSCLHLRLRGQSS